MTAFRS